ncbi:sensor histidine kinase [Planctomicrobium sp. SH527]|uniref:sensor histidine kinase n=1 Tax=Planctomicrobium sp. SH527 TaxID=3448123 RepID=UPI003F5B9CB5
MKQLRSIRVRLLGLIGLLLLITLSGFGYVAWHRESAARIAAVDRDLQERLNLLISAYRPGRGQRLEEVSEPRFSTRARDLFANEGSEAFYYWVWLSDGRVQGHAEHAPQVEFPVRTPEAKTLRMRGTFRELVHFTPTGRCFLVGRSIHLDRAAMHTDATSLMTFGLGILLVGLALAWWIASRMTRPLVEVSQTARKIAAGDLSQRIHVGNADDELSDVANVLNETFSRLESAFARQVQFTADASHELRTPVALILAHAQGVLLHEQSPAEYREALADCVQAAQRMKTLIESLLDLARFDAAAEPIDRQPCDLANLVRDCTKLLRPLIQAKHLHIDLDLQPASSHADPARLTQVIINLLTNAIHFTPAEGTITIQTRQDGTARFSVGDSGPGIAPEQLPHIFERFHRADVSRARATGGTGLGLSICKSIVEAHGGEITVESKFTKGTTFTVLLPASPD